jgi:hypothetical protein
MEQKQTVEEAAEKYINENFESYIFKKALMEIFIDAAKSDAAKEYHCKLLVQQVNSKDVANWFFKLFMKVRNEISEKNQSNGYHLETAIKQTFIEWAASLHTNSNVNYGALVQADKMYPVVYTVMQSGEKVFEPKWIQGKDLTEPQIKYLHELGYFEPNGQ